MEIGTIGPKSNAWEVFGKFLEYIDQAMELLILGSSDIATGAKYGTRASAVVKDKPRQGRLENDIDILSTVSREQILRPYYYWNRGIDDMDQVPHPTWDPSPPEDATRAAEALEKRAIGAKNAAEALEKLVELVPELDVEEFALSYKLPLKGRAAASASLADRHQRLLNSAKRKPPAVPGLGAILKAVQGAKDPEDLRRRVLSTYMKLDPERLARELAIARVKAEQAARQAVEDRLKDGA